MAVFKGRSSAHPADPVLYLDGGPGGESMKYGPIIAQMLAPTYGERDFVVFDQRGVGFSEPSLACPEVDATLSDLLGESNAEVSMQTIFAARLACRDRLVAAGNNLAAYTTAQNAADVEAMRIALGYDEINLAGASYGTLLAQAVMRDSPQHIRSVAMSSVLPLEKSTLVEGELTIAGAVDHLLAACAADGACNKAYPDLRGVLFRTIDRLNARPVAVTLTHPVTGKRYPAVVSGDDLYAVLVHLLYRSSAIPLLPRAIYETDRGDYALLSRLSGLTLTSFDGMSRGMHLSVICTDQLVGWTQQDLLNVLASLPPQYAGRQSVEATVNYGTFATCANWPARQANAEAKQPLVSDIPTLLLAGEFDPVTPPAYAQLVASYLPNSYLYVFPAAGHDVMSRSECGPRLPCAAPRPAASPGISGSPVWRGTPSTWRWPRMKREPISSC